MNEATLRATLHLAIAQLDAARTDAPKTAARVLLAHVLGKPKAWLIANDDQPINPSTLADFHALLARVIAHEPLAYILGHREFYGLDFFVDRRVLIPRPETELLVELALDVLNNQQPITNNQSDLLDIGTGSGAVPVALAHTLPHARILASDVSTDALAVAKINAERNGVAGQITFVQSDLLAGIAQLPRVLTANLPYVTTEEIDGLQPEIQDHEPRVALDGGADGLDLVRKLLMQISGRTNALSHPLQAAFLEFGASQGAAALHLAQTILPFAQANIKQDLAKLDRVLCLYFQ
ncbi:MAG: peptide chain release factor N(5)-glutamine methyltransferase [Anaerolineae bacterium]|nr:peptide chain release factor N(5)-glutamine methyltransferase [Anaerolineae bacterium]